MMPVDFEGSNCDIHKPPSMTDEQCMTVRGMVETDADGFPFTLTVWQPSKEDIEAIVKGGPICLKVVGESMVPVALWTFNEETQTANI